MYPLNVSLLAICANVRMQARIPEYNTDNKFVCNHDMYYWINVWIVHKLIQYMSPRWYIRNFDQRGARMVHL